MKEWSKIDLHIHTEHGIHYDGSTQDGNENFYSLFELYKRNILNNLDLISITNHNKIDILELLRAEYVSKKYSKTYLLPGVELDVIINSERYHIVVIFSKRVDIVKVSYEINKKISEKSSKKFLTYEEFVKIIENTECIIIPHACKTQGFKPNQASNVSPKIADDIIDIIKSGAHVNLLFEHTKTAYKGSFARNVIEMSSFNWMSEDEYCRYIKEKLETNYAATDYRFKESSKKEDFDFISIWGKSSFRGLQLATIFPTNRIIKTSQKIGRSGYIGRVKIEGNNHFADSDIQLSSGLNSIIGNSASGKTTLLHIIAKRIAGKKVRDDKEFEFTDELKIHFFDKDDNPLSKDDLDIKVAESLYDQIKNIHTSDNTNILKLFGYEYNFESDILDSFDKKLKDYTKTRKENLSEAKLAKSSIQTFNDNIINLKNNISPSEGSEKSIKRGNNVNLIEDIDILKGLSQKFKKLKESISDIEKSYNSMKFDLERFGILNNFDNIINKLRNEEQKVRQELNPIWYRKKLKNLIVIRVNNIIDVFNEKLGQKSEYVERVRGHISKSLSVILSSLKDYLISSMSLEQYNLSFPRKELKLELEKRNENDYIELDVNIKDDLFRFEKDNGYISSQGLLTKLNDFKGKEIINDIDIKRVIDEILKEERTLNTNKESFILDIIRSSTLKLGYPKKEKLNILNVSPGDTSKIYIDYMFENEFKNGVYNVILFDQPENDVDKEFIYNHLMKEIQKLKHEVQVIITSHDPLIVINGDSNMIIETKKEHIQIDEKYLDKICYKSYLLDDYVDKYPTTSLISKYIDGSEVAVQIRYNLYTGGKK